MQKARDAARGRFYLNRRCGVLISAQMRYGQVAERHRQPPQKRKSVGSSPTLTTRSVGYDIYTE